MVMCLVVPVGFYMFPSKYFHFMLLTQLLTPNHNNYFYKLNRVWHDIRMSIIRRLDPRIKIFQKFIHSFSTKQISDLLDLKVNHTLITCSLWHQPTVDYKLTAKPALTAGIFCCTTCRLCHGVDWEIFFSSAFHCNMFTRLKDEMWLREIFLPRLKLHLE